MVAAHSCTIYTYLESVTSIESVGIALCFELRMRIGYSLLGPRMGLLCGGLRPIYLLPRG